MTTGTLLSMALFFSVLLIWLATGRVSRYLDRLLERVDGQQANRLISGMLLVPLQLVLLAGVLIAIWFPQEIVLRVSHLAFVLGAIFCGVLAALLFGLPLYYGLDRPLPALLVMLITLPLGVYFLPIRNFAAVFSTGQLGLAGSAGALALVVYGLVLWSLRRAVLQQPVTAG